MKRILYILLALSLTACAGRNGESDQLGPEGIVEAFNRAITAGDFAAAESLCDTILMKDYLDSYKEAWETIYAEDSSALAIASSILSGAVLNITGVRKADDKRIVSYTLEADGHRKERSATVRKEDERWIVERITDSI